MLGGAALLSVTPVSTRASAGIDAACRGASLTAAFSAVPGSAGAGSISYTLRIRNRSSRACFVSGLPRLRLLDRTGRPLPSRVVAAHPGQLTAGRVVLRPGDYAAATARFSPDVPGPGEPTNRPCERTAYRVRVTVPPARGPVTGPIVPPTAVCEHGRMAFSVLVAGRRGPQTP